MTAGEGYISMWRQSTVWYGVAVGVGLAGLNGEAAKVYGLIAVVVEFDEFILAISSRCGWVW